MFMKITIEQLRKIISEEVAAAVPVQGGGQKDFLIFASGHSGYAEGRPVGVMTASSEASAVKLAQGSRRIMDMADGEKVYAVEVPFGESDKVLSLIDRLEALHDEKLEVEQALLAYRWSRSR